MIKKLVVFGDSWTFGDELLAPEYKDIAVTCDAINDQYRMSHCWGGLVAQQLGLEFVNFGFNGASLQSMIWTASWWAQKHSVDDSLIIVGLTQPARTSWYLAQSQSRTPEWNAHVHATWDLENSSQNEQSHWKDLHKIHYAHSHCPELNMRNRQQAVIFFDGFSHRYKIPVFQFDCYKDQTFFYSENHICSGQNAQDWARPHFAIGNHPSELGHVEIAKKLTSWIRSAKIIK